MKTSILKTIGVNWLKKQYKAFFNNKSELKTLKENDWSAFQKAICQYFELSVQGESDLKFNYVENVFKYKKEQSTALVFASEEIPPIELTWQEVETQVASFADFLKYAEVKKGQPVVSITDNVPEQTFGFLACASIGAVWTQFSPSLSKKELSKQLKEIDTNVIIASEAYFENGKCISNVTKLNALLKDTTAKHLIALPAAPPLSDEEKIINGRYWNDIFNMMAAPLTFEILDSNAPLLTVFDNASTKKGYNQLLLIDRVYQLGIEQDFDTDDVIFSDDGLAAPLLIGATLALFSGDRTHKNFADLDAKVVKNDRYDSYCDI